MHNSFKFKLAALLVTVLIGALSYLLLLPPDSYERYRQVPQQGLQIQAMDLQHNQAIESQIRESLKQTSDPKEAAILGGLHWLLGFIDKQDNFEAVFSDFIILSAELARAEKRPLQRQVATQLLNATLARGAQQLSQLFPADNEGLWDFIGILQVAWASEVHRTAYVDFYQRQFASVDKLEYDSELSFAESITKANYEVIGDYLIDTSFLYYFRQKYPGSDIHLPPEQFETYLQQLTQFDYNLSHQYASNEFSDLAYLATHVVLVLTNYGELAVIEGDNTKKVARYIDASYQDVRFKLGDIDLLAEYLQCLKILFKGNEPRVENTEEFLLSLQRSDGSWGSLKDFTEEPYIQFHPTWAVLTGLNHPY